MQQVRDYIDQAAKQTGSKRRLAELLGMAESTLNNAHKGQRGLTAEQATKLAELLDADPLAIWAQVAIEREADQARRQELERRFFHRGIRGAAVCLALLLGAHTDDATANPEGKWTTEGISSRFWRQLKAAMRARRIWPGAPSTRHASDRILAWQIAAAG